MKGTNKYHAAGFFISVTLCAVLLCGCGAYYNTSVVPPRGVLFSNIKAPLTTDFNDTEVQGTLIKSSKKWTYYVHDILFTGISVAWETADIPEIARKGGITEVAYADYEFLQVLGVFAQFTINVYGK